MTEKNIQNSCLLAIGSRDDALIFRQQSGMFRSMNDPKRIVRVGVPGMADSLMIARVTVTPEMVGKTIGVAVFPEFKTTKGRQSEDQRNFQAACSRVSAVYRLVRSESEILALLRDVQDGSCF